MRSRLHVERWAVAGLAIWAAGCSEGSAEQAPVLVCEPNADTCAPGRLLDGCAECIEAGWLTLDLGECTAGSSVAQIEAELGVSAAFVGTFPELRDAGWSTSWFAAQTTFVLSRLAQEPLKDAIPEGFGYSDGVYSGGRGPVEIRASFGKDYEAGKKGDPIGASLFLANSYVTGAKVTTPETGVAKVSYAETGPLVELLGFGPSPPNPFELGLFDAPREIRSQSLATTAHVTSARPGMSVAYDAAWTRDVVVDEPFLVGTTEVPFAVTGLAVTGAPAGVTAEITEWSMGVVTVDHDDARLRGRAEITVKGGRVPHVTTVVFDGEKKKSLPVVSVRCL